MDYKAFIVAVQAIGYMISKFIGIKVIAEMPPNRRAIAILTLIGIAEVGLVIFGIMPKPWNAAGLFLNGLMLGMVFGLVLSFLEGRRLTEALVAGLCASFIWADGVTKSVGAWLLERGVPEVWMPACAGLVFPAPLLVDVGMLTHVPKPSDADVDARYERRAMTREDRWAFTRSYAMGMTLVLVGLVFPAPPVPIELDRIVRRNISIHGVYNYTPDDLNAAVDFLATHHAGYPFDGLVHSWFSLEKAKEAFARAADPSVIRAGVIPSN